MKIKTIWSRIDQDKDFDTDVNQALEKGWTLVKRERQPSTEKSSTLLYAELVLPDPPAEPETPDPIEALHDVVDYCHSVPAGECSTDKCRLFYWCQQLRAGGDPTDWDLPEVDA